MSLRLIAGSTLWQLASQVTMAALSILTVKFVAIGLTKELAGNYNSAYGYLQLFGILADFGLYAVAVHAMSAAKDKQETLSALIVLRAIVLVGSLTIALVIAWTTPAWRGTPLPLGITIAALVPFFTLLAGMIRVVFQVRYKMHLVFIAEVTQRIITASLIGFFIVMGVRGSSDLQIYHLFLFIGGIGAFTLFLISYSAGSRLMTIRPTWNTEKMKELAKKALPYGIAFFCMALYRQFDVTLISLLRDDFELQNAYYGFVVRMMDMGFLLPTFLLNSVLPLLGDTTANKERTSKLFSKTLFIILLLGIISALFASLWSRPLIALLTTASYLSTPEHAGSDTALRLLSIPLLLNGLILFQFYILLTMHKWQRLVKIMLTGAALSIALNLFLIPLYGFVGACITSIIIHLFLSVFLWLRRDRSISIHIQWKEWMHLAIFAGLLAGTLIFIKPLLTNELTTVIGLAIASITMLVLLPVTGLWNDILRNNPIENTK